MPTSLCSKCAGIKLDDLLTKEAKALLWARAARELSISAASCELCAVLVAECRPAELENGDGILRLRSSRDKEGTIALHGMKKKLILVGAEMQEAEWEDPTPMATAQLHYEGDERWPLARVIHERSVRAADDPRKAREWIDKCRDTHASCSPSSSLPKTSFTPTRLLDVHEVETTGAVVVVEPLGAGAVEHYVALSYRWGGASSLLTTTTSNLDKHKERIDIGHLCTTIRDAMVFAWRLGYRYIWVDSLCILQDSAADWENESSLMADVYMNAAVTLAAAAATSGDSGLFFPRQNHLSAKMKQYSQGQASGIPSGALYVTNCRLQNFESEVTRGPLNTRGWVLQERILSPRAVHFGKTQLFWECRTTSRQESRNRDEDLDQRRLLTLSKFAGKIESHDNHAKFITWYDAVSDYTKRSLTVAHDKLPAIRGISQLFQARNPKCRYIYGLWSADLPRGLLWCADSGAKLARPAQFRAPSWSWASRDGPVVFDAAFPSKPPEWKRQLLPPKRLVYWQLDALSKKKLNLRVRLQVVRMGPAMKVPPASGPDALPHFKWPHSRLKVFDTKNKFVGEAALDDLDETPTGTQLHGLLIFIHPSESYYVADRGRGPTAFGVLLRKLAAEGHFERVGTFRAVASIFDNVDAVPISIA